jgi:hypothetical protein
MDDDEDESPMGADDEVALPLEDYIDLHSFPPRDIPDVVEAYLEQALQAGIPEVRLIHGRGTGVQRQRVRSVLEKHPRVTGFSDATADRGGWGRPPWRGLDVGGRRGLQPSPRRRLASVAWVTSVHQSSLSRYHPTVARRPSAKVTDGVHPSSSAMREASMA